MAKVKARPAAATKTGAKTKKATDALVKAAEKRTAVDRERAEELIALIQRRQGTITESFYDIGEALREILRKKYYVALGHASFADLLEKRGLMSYGVANRLIEVVDKFPRGKALALGAEKAYALARLADATPEADTGPLLAEAEIVVGGAKKLGGKASVREITAAAREQRAKARGPEAVSPEERGAKAAARRAQAALRRGGLKGAKVEPRKASGKWKLVIELDVEAADVFEAAWPLR